MLLLALIMSLLVAYHTMTRIEMTTTEASMNSVRGLYAAEAGLNVRADQVRQIFQGYNRPAGTAPTATDPCTGTNLGSGDLACAFHALQQRNVTTFVNEEAGNPTAIVVPRGEPFQNLNAQEYRYAVLSRADGPEGRTEAMLEMLFKSRLIPMFQFAAFYNKDLEILPGPAMLLEGPVHTNGDLYMGSGDRLDILGQVTTAGDLYNGRKNANTCMGGVSVIDPVNLAGLPACSGGTTLLNQTDLDAWNGMIETGVEVLTVPPPEALEPNPGEVYWDLADIRVMLDLDQSPPAIQVHDPGGNPNPLDTATLSGCSAVSHSNTMYNNREGTAIEMLDVNVEALLNCLSSTSLLGPGKDLSDTSQGGLVFYLGVSGPDEATLNNYGVRVRNGAELASTAVGAPEIQGLTVVTDQAIYVEGSYNAANKKPAAFLCDSLNILSNAWNDSDSSLALSHADRQASNTTINAAFLSGTDSTDGVEGTGPVFGDAYNGGLENYPRFHENWTGRTLTYRGSFVSLNTPRHVDGVWVYGSPQYTAPNRDWRYDTDFNNAENLPPLSPRFVSLKQELFMRQFEL
jgi:hypothetical protein